MTATFPTEARQEVFALIRGRDSATFTLWTCGPDWDRVHVRRVWGRRASQTRTLSRDEARAEYRRLVGRGFARW